nr:MAG TPA: hypothetical protein [Caudoviricetes sp.]
MKFGIFFLFFLTLMVKNSKKFNYIYVGYYCGFTMVQLLWTCKYCF